MKSEFNSYLESLVLSGPIMQRINQVFNFYKTYCPEEILDIFITDYFNTDSSRTFENLWFFSNNYWMEAKNFITDDDFDMCPVNKRINYWCIKKQNYDFNVENIASDKSRLYIKVEFDTGIKGEFKASVKNCGKLKEIFTKYLLPNFKI